MMRRRARLIGWGLLVLMVLLFALLLSFCILERDRVFVITAETRGASISFDGAGNRWSLEQPVVCTPKARPDMSITADPGPCDARRYDLAAPASLTVNWGDSSAVRLEAGQGLSLVILSHASIPVGTRIVLDQAAWERTGVLAVSGRVVIGEQIASGATHYLVSGQYEVRERPQFSVSTEIVRSGELRRGETARVVASGTSGTREDAPVYAHITPAENASQQVTVATGPGGTVASLPPEVSSFEVNVIARPGRTALEIGFFGGGEPSLITPTWVDRALSSPIFIALSLVLSLLLAAGQILLSVVQWDADHEENASGDVRVLDRGSEPEQPATENLGQLNQHPPLLRDPPPSAPTQPVVEDLGHLHQLPAAPPESADTAGLQQASKKA